MNIDYFYETLKQLFINDNSIQKYYEIYSQYDENIVCFSIFFIYFALVLILIILSKFYLQNK